jgi:hypothetical protein
MDSGATNSIDLGSDHRTVFARLKLCKIRKRRRGHAKPKPVVGWRPADVDEYNSKLHQSLEDVHRNASLELKGEHLQDQFCLLEASVRQTAEACKAASRATRAKTVLTTATRDLIIRRREIQYSEQSIARSDRASLSKLIQKNIRKDLRAHKREEVAEKVTAFKDLRSISGIKKRRKKHNLVSIKDAENRLQTSRQEIMDVFADFYGDLYKANADHKYHDATFSSTSKIEDITEDEVRIQLNKMKKHKAGDSAGSVAEMLQYGSQELCGILAKLFSKILRFELEPPEAWKESLISVLYKKGDPTMPGNYRPICLLPILYKLFSKIICERITSTLERAQTVDQAGFRAGFSCEDHLLSVVLLVEAYCEHNLPLWLCTVDFAKAFDSVEHASLWAALYEQGEDGHYIRLLASLYENQVGKIRGPPISKSFKIQRGSKQGDPMSPKLFNAVLEKVFKRIQLKWAEKDWGIKVDGKRLTNLRFADDVILVASSKNQVAMMLEDLATAAAEVGLQIHMGKTKVLSNSNENTGGHILMKGKSIEVVSFSSSTEYLGRLLTMDSLHDTEISNRIQKGWSKFFVFKSELCGKHVSIKDKFKLFNAVVTPTVLYGSAAWTMNADRTRLLRTAQRRMLRWMLGGVWQGFLLGAGNGDEVSEISVEEENVEEPAQEEEDDILENESWIDWMRRRTIMTESVLQSLRLDDWVKGQRRRKWAFAGHLMRREDSRWASVLLPWVPEGGKRSRGRPKKRWTDDLDDFFYLTFGTEGYWIIVAANREEWRSLEDAFAQNQD